MMYKILFGLCLFLLIYYIYWQYKVMAKYSFNYDHCKIDASQKFLLINKQKIDFSDIDSITVEELEQPDILEKTFTRSGRYTFLAEMHLHMKNGEIRKCKFNYRGILYKALKELEPYIKIECDIEKYQITFTDKLIAIVLLICIIVIINSLFH